MEFTSPAPAAMQPPTQGSPELEQGGGMNTNGNADGTSGIGMGITTTPNTAATGSAQIPKVVQTAFIHKLYNMLEDRSIQHLISWSGTNESFVMSPSNEFSKVLAQYFKHTNISSFVRQLNMYGFHKVSDVFHTGSPDSTLWEFKHGNGSFKKCDLTGLREIKRRASRHALIHRDSFSGQKPTASQPGTPAEPMPDTTEARLLNLESAFYEMHTRLARTEDSYALMSSRCQALTEGLVRCHQVGQSATPNRVQGLTANIVVDTLPLKLCTICHTHRKLSLYRRYA
jgi:HSF-type DNA-binding